MNKLVILFVMLLLVSVVGCGTADNAVGPDTSDQIQTDDTAQKPAVPHEPPGDPDGTIGGRGDPDDGVFGP